MNSWKAITTLAVTLTVLCAGCGTVEKSSTLQKNAAIGGGSGGVLGALAVAGPSTSLGGGPAALIGMGLGATTGALITDVYYENPEEAGAEPEELKKMQSEVQNKSKKLSALQSKLEETKSQKQALLEAHQKTRKKLEKMKDKMGSDAEVTQNKKGTYKMTILSDVIFDSGSADLNSEGKSTLAKAASQIKKQFPNASIEVRGHTDNVPIKHSGWDSNWELSSARALAVVRYLINEEGFSKDKLRAVGMADTQPVASNSTASGRKKNRRAEIIIRPESQTKTEEIEIQD